MNPAAEFGITLDADGFIVNANRAAGALVGLGGSAARTQSQVRQFATQGAMSLGSLAASGARDIGSLMRSASGLAFALNPLAGAISLAVVGIGTAWAEARREAKKHQDDMLADARAFAQKLMQEQENGILGQAGATQKRLRAEAARAQAELVTVGLQIANARPMFAGAGGGMAIAPDTRALEQQKDNLVTYLTAIQRELAATEKETTRITVEEATKRAKADEDAWEKRLKAAEDVTKIMRGLVSNDVIVGGFAGLFGASPVKAPDVMADIAASAKNLGREFHDSILPGIKAFLDGLEEAQRRAQMLERIRLGAGIGIAGALFNQMGGFGSVISGALSGGLSGAAGGPAGIAIGATQGLIGGLLSLASASDAAEDRAEALRLQFESFTDAMKEQLGIMPALEARTREVQRQFAAMRDAMGEGLVEASDLVPSWLQTSAIAEAKARISELNVLERQYLDLLKQQEQQRINDIAQEQQVLTLRIIGRNEEAEAMQRQIDYQRELTDAMNAGASAAEQFAIKEKHRLAEILIAVQKHEANIAAFTATIGGLQSFRNALLLSPDAGLSPTQQLAEARRQYDEILLKALGGDQGAAGQLSGSAQTLLNFSRSVNASGPAFQEDLAQILADNAEVIQRFEALKSIEEQMLEELRRIAQYTNQLNETLISPVGSIPTVELLQAGFVALRDELQQLRGEVRENTQVSRQGFAEFTTVSLN